MIRIDRARADGRMSLEFASARLRTSDARLVRSAA
jgi:hypothetical protein